MNFIVNKYQGNIKLLLIECDEDEQNFLELNIGEIVKLVIPKPPIKYFGATCDCGELFPESGYCKFCGCNQ